MSQIKRHIDQINSLIGFAVKEGYLDIDEVERMSLEEKEAYYDRSMSIDPFDLIKQGEEI